MHIGIDARDINYINKPGFEHYISNLIQALSRIDQENNYTLYLNCKLKREFTIANKNFKWRILRFPFSAGWTQCRLPLDSIKFRPDILFFPAHSLPFYRPYKSVVVIHDLLHLNDPSRPLWDRMRLKILTKKAIENASHIIAISHFTKNEIQQYYNIRESKISVVYHGNDNRFKQITDMDKISETKYQYKIKGDYILYAGTLRPYKNVNRLIKAFCRIKKEKKIEHQLVIVGGKGWGHEDTFNLVNRLGLSQEIIFTGFIEREELPLLMNGASLFVMPSLSEGFGFPAIEAMACGAPVLSSNVACIPEILGKGGYLINPLSEDDIADGMIKILEDRKLQKELIMNGLKRAKQFTWEKSAQKVLKIFTDLTPQCYM